jgi:excisionase family DNA binding protein
MIRVAARLSISPSSRIVSGDQIASVELFSPTVETVHFTSERPVVQVDSQYWGERAPQLAALLHTGVQGPIGDLTRCRAEAVAMIADPEYWSCHVRELADALLGAGHLEEPCRAAVAVGVSPGSSERLTMSVEEVAKALGISRAFAYEAVHRGDIPHIKIGKRMLVPRAALARVLAAADPPDDS